MIKQLGLLFIFIFLMQAFAVSQWETLFPNESWNKFPAQDVSVYSGKLVEKNNSGQNMGIMQRENLYQLETSDGQIDVYTGSERLKTMYIGNKVEIRGKLTEFELEGTQIKEIWPTEIRLQ